MVYFELKLFKRHDFFVSGSCIFEDKERADGTATAPITMLAEKRPRDVLTRQVVKKLVEIAAEYDNSRVSASPPNNRWFSLAKRQIFDDWGGVLFTSLQ